MERKENLNDPKGTTAAASKKAPARKQPGNEAAGSPAQNTSQGNQNQDKDQDLLQTASQATGEIVNQVQQRAGSTLSRQKESAATDLSQVVQAVRQFGQNLAGQEGGGPIARYAAEYGDKAANSLERLSTYIREQDPKQLLNDVQNFGRRRPALLLGGAFLLGFAGARLIKSSMDTESRQTYNADTPAPRPSTANVPAPTQATPNVTAMRPPTTTNAI